MDAAAETAIGSGNHVLPPDDLREADDAVGNQPRMLECTLVAWLTTPGMSSLPSGNFVSRHTRHSCSWRTLPASTENAPARTFSMTSTMFSSGRSVRMRSMPAPPADVIADAIFRQSGKRVVQRLDAHFGEFLVFRDRRLRVRHVPIVRQAGIVELQHKAGIEDRLVFLLERVGEGVEIFLVGLVILVLGGARSCLARPK